MKDSTSGGRTIHSIQIHYFENFFDYLGKLKASTYNIFELREDFLNMILTCQEIIPSRKHELVQRIKELKDAENKADD